jgi:hypothetical protein
MQVYRPSHVTPFFSILNFKLGMGVLSPAASPAQLGSAELELGQTDLARRGGGGRLSS